MTGLDDSLVDAEFVIARFEEAGRTLLAMRISGAMPSSYGSGWPDIVRSFADMIGAEPDSQGPRVPVPSAASIDRMDEAWTWMSHIPLSRAGRQSADPISPHGGAYARRLVLMRAIVSPRTGRHKFSWRRMQEHLGVPQTTLRLWHSKAIATIVTGVNKAKVTSLLQKPHDIGHTRHQPHRVVPDAGRQ